MSDSAAPSQDTINQFVRAAHGDFATVKALADQYPSILTASAVWNETALGAASQTANREIIAFLLERGLELDVFAAAALGQTERVRAFLDADPSLVHATGVHEFPILWFTMAGNQRETTELLLQRGADVNAGVGVSTPLHAAAWFGRRDLAELLLDRGADFTARDFEGKTPLGAALKGGRAAVADLLRERGAVE